MAITKDKVLSLLVFAAVAVIVVTALNAAAVPGVGVFIALMVSVFGLMLIWFAEPLAEAACFSRGVPRPSPAGLIMFFGWVFLVGYPLLLTYVSRAA
jgi:FtsH-binding integral membrane protein